MNTVTVSQLNEYLKRKFDSDYMLKGVAVSGEISNYVLHSSGHSYFTLKDKGGIIKAVMFKGYKSGLAFQPKNGMLVVATGEVSVYPRDGVYQLYVMNISEEGRGSLWLEFEKLKNKLQAEGLFDPAIKKPLPAYPASIAVITSETGAVRHDIENVITRRFPLCRIALYPARVQGAGAAETVINALFDANEDDSCDIIIIARGGGSLEELWEFNSEALARAVRASNIPVVSAVGHETDFTICDFAADLRAPTPSAAAELCVPSADDIRLTLDGMRDTLNASLSSKLMLQHKKIDICREKLMRDAERRISSRRIALERLSAEARRIFEKLISQRRAALDSAGQALEAMNPGAVMARGYAMLMKEGRVLGGLEAVVAGDSVDIITKDGRAKAEITEVIKNDI